MSSDIVLTALWGLKTVEGDEVPFGKDQIKLILSAQLFLLKMILCINCSPYNVFAFVNLELHSSKSWEPCVFVTAQAYDFSRTELVQQIVSYRVICRLSGRRCTRKWTHQPIWRLQLNCFSSRTVYAGARCHQNGRRPSSLHLCWRRNRLARVMGPRSQVPTNEMDTHTQTTAGHGSSDVTRELNNRHPGCRFCCSLIFVCTWVDMLSIWSLSQRLL